MMSPASIALVLAAVLCAPAVAPAQTPAADPPPQAPVQPRDPIALGATTEQRNAAAQALLPLLRDVRRRGQSGVTVKPGTVPDSPFAGTQTTLFAFAIGQRSLPVDTRVVAAMDRLGAWQVDDASDHEAGRLFDQWLSELLVKNATAALISGAPPCDVPCVARRMTTLDESWGASPRTRAESRDEMLLEALTAAVIK